MREAATQVAQIEQALRQRQAALVQFRHDSQAQEQALFSAMQGKPVLLRQLDEFQETLMGFKERDLVLQHQITQAETALLEARKVLAARQQALAEASKAREALSEFAAAEVAELRREQEALEEDEIEELVANNYAFAASRG